MPMLVERGHQITDLQESREQNGQKKVWHRLLEGG